MNIKKIMLAVAAVVCCLLMTASLAACDSGEKQKESGDIYYITYDGTKIELGAKAEGVLGALGEAKEVKELGDCGGLGAQIKYSYNDFDLYTLKSGDNETVDQITLRSDLVSTSKGICIGDSSDKVIEAYGEPASKSDKELKYVSGELILKFKISGGSVTDIDYIRVTQ